MIELFARGLHKAIASSLKNGDGLSLQSSRQQNIDGITKQGTSDKAMGSVMLLVASFVFVYYTTWAILLVCLFSPFRLPFFNNNTTLTAIL
jgi:hypothetical protein